MLVPLQVNAGGLYEHTAAGGNLVLMVTYCWCSLASLIEVLRPNLRGQKHITGLKIIAIFRINV